jgi:hypothetical protein
MATEPDYRHMTSGRITGTDEEDTEDQVEEEAWDEDGTWDEDGAGALGRRTGPGQRTGAGPRTGPERCASREDRLTRRRYRDDS